MLAERFQKFPDGRTSGEAALSAHNEERGAFRVWVLNRYVKRKKPRIFRGFSMGVEFSAVKWYNVKHNIHALRQGPVMTCAERE